MKVLDQFLLFFSITVMTTIKIVWNWHCSKWNAWIVRFHYKINCILISLLYIYLSTIVLEVLDIYGNKNVDKSSLNIKYSTILHFYDCNLYLAITEIIVENDFIALSISCQLIDISDVYLHLMIKSFAII